MESELATKVQVKLLKTSDPSLPLLVLQITQMVDTYMLWIGTADSNEKAGSSEKAVLNGNLCKDWACAMPPRVSGAPSAATSLFRSSSSDVALPMAQRLGFMVVPLLAKRFQKQIFLSVDIPANLTSMGQSQRLVFEAEKGIVNALKEIEKVEKTGQQTALG